MCVWITLAAGPQSQIFKPVQGSSEETWFKLSGEMFHGSASALAAVLHGHHFAINYLGRDARAIADRFAGKTAAKGSETHFAARGSIGSSVSSHLAESECVSLNTRVEKLDLECAVADGAALSDELVEAL